MESRGKKEERQGAEEKGKKEEGTPPRKSRGDRPVIIPLLMEDAPEPARELGFANVKRETIRRGICGKIAHLVARVVKEERPRKVRQGRGDVGKGTDITGMDFLRRHVVPALRIAFLHASHVDFRTVRRDIVQIRAEPGRVGFRERGDL